MPVSVSQRRFEKSTSARSFGKGTRPWAARASSMGALVDDDVHQRRRHAPVSGSGDRLAEDRLQRVVAALGVGAGEQRCRRIGTVQPGALGDVGVELALDLGIEDRDHLGGGQCVAARGSQVQGAVELDGGGGAVRDVRRSVGVRAIEVGEDLPAAQAGSGLVEAQLLCLFEQHVDRVDQLVAAARIGTHPGQLVGLSGADVAVPEGVADLGDGVDESSEPAQPIALGARIVRVRLEPPGDRVVVVDDMDRAPLALGHDRCHLGLDPTTLQLETTEGLGEGRVIEVPERVDNRGQHGSMISNM
jgi:hypothetical protein